MPSTDKAKSSTSVGKKQRLGRGLGSLLNTSAADFEEAPATTNQRTQSSKAQSPNKAKVSPSPTQTSTDVQEKSSSFNNLKDNQRVWSLPIEKVIPNQSQPRKDFDKEPLEELSQSIKVQGVLQPITVRKVGESYEIIAGERRWRASQMAGLKEVPAIVKEVDDRKAMELALIENLQREDLNPVEEAMGYQLLIDDYNLSQQELATQVGKSRSAVTNALRVLSLPRDVKQMLRQGLLTLGHAKVLMGVEDEKTLNQLARKTIKKKWSVRMLEKQIKALSSPEDSTKDENQSISNKLARSLATELQSLLGTKVNIDYKQGKGKIHIAFYSDDELSHFVEKVKNHWRS